MDFYSDEQLFDRFGVQSTTKVLNRADLVEKSKTLFFHDDDDNDNGRAGQCYRELASLSLLCSRTAQKDAERIAVQLYGKDKRGETDCSTVT
jgi:hypothetical protein